MNKLKIYNDLCNSRKKISRCKSDGNYYERHHIIPKWLGGNDSKDNLVLLTAKEHYIAHYLLFMHYRDRSSAAAFHRMNNTCNMKYRCSKKYEEVRKWQSENLKGSKNPAKRKEVREKISNKIKGDKNGMFGRTGNKNPFYGKTHSKEFLRYKQILHSNKILIRNEENTFSILFECVGDAAEHFECTKENIRFRVDKKPGKFGKFKNLIVEIVE